MKNPQTKTETLKRIAEWYCGEGSEYIDMVIVKLGYKPVPSIIHLKLILKYREWLQCEVAYFTMNTDKAFMRATESTDTLLKAIATDVLGMSEEEQ